MDWWLSNYVQWFGANFAIAWVLWVILSITFHELAHGWVAIRCGDDVPVHTGHMTWNPFVHIPFPFAWILFAVFGFTWGLMPTNPANYRGRYDEAKVAFAGPAMNLLLFVLCVVGDVLWLVFAKSVQNPLNDIVHSILWVGVVINLMGFVFNLIPVPPLDGSRIVASLVPSVRSWGDSGGAQAVRTIAMIALFWFGPRYIWPAVFLVAEVLVGVSTKLAGGEYRSLLPP
jgi:Zn-dependent protease